jgi:RimJ/RimL family protein N-acetyltransferase
MITEVTKNDFDAMLAGVAREGLHVAPDVVIAPPDVLAMLRSLADDVRERFTPAAWWIVNEGEVVGLCSVIRVPREGDVHIGYGIAPTRQGRGFATEAVSRILAWARSDPRVAQISAETGVENIASQRVLERNGFLRVGQRLDAEDGLVFCWRAMTE